MSIGEVLADTWPLFLFALFIAWVFAHYRGSSR
jgi:hypothetical protein